MTDATTFPPRFPPRQLPLRFSLDDEATFANFYLPEGAAGMPGRQLLDHLNNRLSAWAVADQVTTPGTVLQDFTWVWGAQGAGCTHVLQAVCHAVGGAGQAAFYLSFGQLAQLTPDVLQGLEQMAVLCLDDVEQVIGNREWELALFHLYNRMCELQTPLLVAAHTNPKHLVTLLPDLASRLQSAAVFRLPVLSDEDKIEALRMRAQRRGFTLSDEVAGYLINRVGRDMPTLFNVLQDLDRLSMETGRRVTIPLLKEHHLLQQTESQMLAGGADMKDQGAEQRGTQQAEDKPVEQ